MNLEALVAPLRADVVSGAAVVARAASAAMRRGAIQLPADSTAKLKSELEGLATRVLASQPSMAPLVNLMTHVLEAVEAPDDLEGARRAAAHAAEEFRVQLERENREIATALAQALPERRTILTLSSSSSIRSGLLKTRKGLRVICLEARPQCEGQGLARTLAQAGIPVTLAVDAAVEAMVARSDLVVVGADSVGDAGVVNKIGTVGVARAAQAHGVPVWVVAGRSKWLPPGFPQFVADDRPADEVWRGARGVRVWNRYFECLDFDLMNGLVSADGLLTRDQLDQRRAAMKAAPALLEWAERRTTENEHPS